MSDDLLLVEITSYLYRSMSTYPIFEDNDVDVTLLGYKEASGNVFAGSVIEKLLKEHAAKNSSLQEDEWREGFCLSWTYMIDLVKHESDKGRIIE